MRLEPNRESPPAVGLRSVPGFAPAPASFSATDFLIAGVYCSSTELVDRIRRGESGSIEALCAKLRILAYCHLTRKVDSQYRDDKFHDVVVAVLEAISTGTLKQPDRLLGFVSTIARRGVAAQVRADIKNRRCISFEESDFAGTKETSPESAALQIEEYARLNALLGALRPRDRDILTRFYLREENSAQICQEMRLTATQFRLYKSRALARCAAASAGADNSPQRLV
jgi:RNA polymerase sigma factor (sigma-70 family)